MAAELFCTFCGHGVGEVTVPSRGHPSNAELRAAYEEQRPVGGPLWIDDQPRCPRCRGQLFLDSWERSPLRRAS